VRRKKAIIAKARKSENAKEKERNADHAAAAL
jgi:hypothetical protein